ncbi:response regulator transcription factor [Dermatobacter hominis]|uniref:response regulator transcription factor n=1 Tax=Dermatobacter hominis TaxID=2884263 RepID=UPI001D1172C6|nr:response regulator transcription factor [Dermatobacter hominis]UDY37453.1 response regulator transcription factor [Dermatobacter hominis]
MGQPPHRSRPIPVAVVNDYDLVVEGLSAMLSTDERLDVRQRITLGEPVLERVDVALYDSFGRSEPGVAGLLELSREPLVGAVVLFSIDLPPHAIDEAIAVGAAGYVSKALDAHQIADALLQVAAGSQVRAEPAGEEVPSSELVWPGRDRGLSLRESEVLVRAAEGLTNAEIGAALFIGVETVKTHLRAAFAKLGVRNRVEAASFVHRTEQFRRVGEASGRT